MGERIAEPQRKHVVAPRAACVWSDCAGPPNRLSSDVIGRRHEETLKDAGGCGKTLEGGVAA